MPSSSRLAASGPVPSVAGSGIGSGSPSTMIWASAAGDNDEVVGAAPRDLLRYPADERSSADFGEKIVVRSEPAMLPGPRLERDSSLLHRSTRDLHDLG